MRVIDEKGKNLGIMDLKSALQQAQERNLDLIQVTSRVEPPVCRIDDFGKYLYSLKKKEKGAKKGEGQIKGIKLTFNISDHDLETRIRQAAKFLEQGKQVRIELRLKGREKALQDFAKKKIELFLEKLKEQIPFKTIQRLQRKGARFLMTIVKT